MHFNEVTPLSPALLISELRAGSEWTIALCEPDQLDQAEREIVAEAEVQGVELEVVYAEPDIGHTMDVLASRPSCLTLLVLRYPPRETALTTLDLNRARLPQDRPMVVLTTPEIGRQLLSALHFATLVKRADLLDLEVPTLGVEEVAERLGALRSWAGFDDEEVIRRAERGTLPSDPDYAEWLILLGRGDLLVDR